jgi:hypothetical protein
MSEAVAEVLTNDISTTSWYRIFWVSSISGVAFAVALAGIIYGSRVSDPENTLTYKQAVEKTILCGIYLGLTCGLLYILAKYYKYNLELIIMSAILLAGILASIGTSIPWQSLIGIGIVFIWVSVRGIYLIIKKKQKDKANAESAATEHELEYVAIA